MYFEISDLRGGGGAVTKMPGLVAFWTFGEEAGQPRVSVGTREKHPLQEVGGPIPRVRGGPYSGYSAEMRHLQDAARIESLEP